MATRAEQIYRGQHQNERKVAGQAPELSEDEKWDFAESLFAPSKRDEIRKARKEGTNEDGR